MRVAARRFRLALLAWFVLPTAVALPLLIIPGEVSPHSAPLVRAGIGERIVPTAAGPKGMFGSGKAAIQPEHKAQKQQIRPSNKDDLRTQLEAADASQLGPLLESAYARFLVEMQEYRGNSGKRLAETMHARAAATWSAICLASAQRRTGEFALAVGTLEKQIESTERQPERVVLLEALAMSEDAFDRQGKRLDALGAAYAQGGRDAQQMLANMALLDGRFGESARLFGALVDRARVADREPDPWALPGWGLSLLEGVPDRESTEEETGAEDEPRDRLGDGLGERPAEEPER